MQARRGCQKRSPLQPESQVVTSHLWLLGTEFGPLGEPRGQHSELLSGLSSLPTLFSETGSLTETEAHRSG